MREMGALLPAPPRGADMARQLERDGFLVLSCPDLLGERDRRAVACRRRVLRAARRAQAAQHAARARRLPCHRRGVLGPPRPARPRRILLGAPAPRRRHRPLPGPRGPRACTARRWPCRPSIEALLTPADRGPGPALRRALVAGAGLPLRPRLAPAVQPLPAEPPRPRAPDRFARGRALPHAPVRRRARPGGADARGRLAAAPAAARAS